MQLHTPSTIYLNMSKVNPKSKPPPRPSDQPQPLRLQRYLFSSQFASLLTKLAHCTRQQLPSLARAELQSACQVELARIKQLKHQDGISQHIDNELSVAVMANQAAAINESKPQTASSRRVHTEGEESLAKHIERVALVIERSDMQLRRALEGWRSTPNPDLVACYRFFLKQGVRMRHLGHERLVLCRWHLIEAVRYLLGTAIRRFQPQSSHLLAEQLSSQEEKQVDQYQELTLDELPYSEINGWWRMSSQHIQDKLIQLSGICEQIPQLQVFNRNLQFSQLTPPQKQILFKIVEVLISLHNRIGYLSRRKPQLLKEFEHALTQITSINTSISVFLEQIESEQAQINQISFEQTLGSHSLGEAFGELKRHLVKMGEVIVSQDIYHSQNYGRIERMLNMVELFVRVIGGQQEYIGEWEDLLGLLQEGSSGSLSAQESRLVGMLEQCLELHRVKAQTVYQERASTSRTNLQLEEEVNKLIEDYERLKGQNTQLNDELNDITQQREEMLLDLEEKDSMIANLSQIKIVLEKRLQGIGGQEQEAAREFQHERNKLGEENNRLKEQLRASEEERQRLNTVLQMDKQRYLKTYESMTRLKSQKQRWQIEFQDSKYTIQSLKNDHLRKTNQLNKDITNLNNDKSLLQMQLESAEKNNMKLLERLETSQRKMAEYNRLVMARMDEEQQETVSVDADKLRREVERYRTRAEGLEGDIQVLRNENVTLKQRIRELKASQGQNTEQDILITEIKTKLEKANTKNTALRRENQELREMQEELRTKEGTLTKKMKQLEARQRQSIAQTQRLRNEIDHRARKGAELQRELSDVRDRLDRQTRSNRENLTRKELELSDKTSQIESLELRLRKLEQRLSRKQKQAQNSAQEAGELRVKQYETTIEQHKLIQIKMEEQAKGLKSELEQKIQVEFKLNLQIDRLSKQINRLKQLLDRHLKELTQKQQLIKFEREKNEKAVRRINEFEAREKARQQTLTPNRVINMKDRLDQTQQINDGDSAFSRSEKRYDPHFNSKEYERLSKEYYDFRKSVAEKVEKLEQEVQKAITEKRDAELRAQKMQAECRRLLGGSGEGVQEMRRRLDEMERTRKRELGELQTQLERALEQNGDYRRRSGQVESGLRQQMARTIEGYEQKLKRMGHQKDRVINDLMVQLREGKGGEVDWKKKYDELNHGMAGIGKERDVMRSQYESVRSQLEEERRRMRAMQGDIHRLRSMQGELMRLKEVQIGTQTVTKGELDRVRAELEREKLSLQRERSELEREKSHRIDLEQQLRSLQMSLSKSTVQVNLEYYLTRIKLLEQALDAVGSELNDAKMTDTSKGKRGNQTQLSSSLHPPETLNATINSSFSIIAQSRVHSNMVQSRVQSTELEQAKRELNRLSAAQADWNQKEALYLAKLEQMTRQMAVMKDSLSSKPAEKDKIVTTLSLEGRPLNSTYLEHQPPTPSQHLPEGQAANFLNGLDQTLQAGHQWVGARLIELLQQNRVNPNLIKEVDELRLFCLRLLEQTWVLKQQHSKLLQLATTSSSTVMENLIEYSFRILTYFSEIEAGSPEAKRVRQELESTANNYHGGMFFTVLQEYTIHLLTNNAIERYKRELRLKARELLEIKEKLDELITRQLQQQEQIINRPQPITPRARDPYHYKETL